MMRAVPLLLVMALIGFPLGLAPTDAVLAWAGGAAFFAVVGVLIGNSALLSVGVALSLVEALLAFVQGSGPLNLWLALLLGVVIYILLEINAFLNLFHGVALEKSVVRMKATYWGGLALILGATGLIVGLLAAILARPSANPLLFFLLSGLMGAIAVGAALGALRAWRPRADDFLKKH